MFPCHVARARAMITVAQACEQLGTGHAPGPKSVAATALFSLPNVVVQSIGSVRVNAAAPI